MQAKNMKGLEGLVAYTKEQAGLIGWQALGAMQERAAACAATQGWPRPDEEEWRRSPVKDFNLDDLQWGGLSRNSASAPRELPDFLCRPVNDFESEACADLDHSDFSVLVSARVTREGLGASVQISESLAARGLEVAFAGLPSGSLPDGKGSGLSDVASRALEGLFGRIGEVWDNRFQTWNLAAPDALLCIYLPQGLVLEREVLVDWNFDLADRGVNTLVLVYAGQGSQARIVEHMSSTEGFFLNAGRYVDLADNAQLDWEVFQDLDDQTVMVGHGHAFLGRDARHALREAQLGGGWIKARHGLDLLGEGSQGHLEGLYFGSREQHVDLRTLQNHVSPRAWSRALYKGVVKDQSRTIYQGLIHVHPHAPKTDSYLNNKNIILNDGARADSIPSLNIETDDVKCSHGSTTGRIDPEELYYLQNRGFSPEDAKNILVAGFLDQVCTQMSPLIRTAIQSRVAQRIRES